MKCANIEKIVKFLVKNYPPFSFLSPNRINDVIEIIRFIDLRKGEKLHLKSNRKNDYLFLIEGRIDVSLSNGVASLMNFDDKNYKPFLLPASIEYCMLVANEDAVACHVDREMLDKLISWDEVVNMNNNVEMVDRLGKLRDCPLLRSLPLECIELAFERMKFVEVKKGDEVIRQGEEGNTFYIISSGRAEVWQSGLYDDKPQLVDELGEGHTFGNHGVITGQRNNKTVRMLEDGFLLALSKKDFDEIISKKIIKKVNSNIANVMLENDYKLLDVRYMEEYKESYIPGSVIIPLDELKKRIDELDSNSKYIVYCHSGSRSEVAAMKLAQYNIEALSLEGGIRDWPYSIVGADFVPKERRKRSVCRRGVLQQEN